MDSNQPTTSTVTTVNYPPQPGMFGTKIPSSIAFVVGILVFLLPFTEIRCGGTKLMQKSGLDFAMGNEWKTVGGALPGSNNTDLTNKTMSAGKEQSGNTQYFIIGALILGVIGLLLAIANSKGASGGGVLVGVLAAGALIAFMLDLKKNFENSLREQAIDKATDKVGDAGLDGISNTMSDIKPTLAFTPWFYIAVLAFLAGALFFYLRMKTYRSNP